MGPVSGRALRLLGSLTPYDGRAETVPTWRLLANALLFLEFVANSALRANLQMSAFN